MVPGPETCRGLLCQTKERHSGLSWPFTCEDLRGHQEQVPPTCGVTASPNESIEALTRAGEMA